MCSHYHKTEIKKNLTELNGEAENNTVIVGSITTPLSMKTFQAENEHGNTGLELHYEPNVIYTADLTYNALPSSKKHTPFESTQYMDGRTHTLGHTHTNIQHI